MDIRYVRLYQAVVCAKKDLLMVSNGYQVCVVLPSISSSKEGPGGGF